MRNRAFASMVAGLALAACSGSGSKGSEGPGNSHVTDDLDTDDAGPVAGDPANPCGDPANPCAGGEPAVDPDAPLVTFELANSHDIDLEFSIEKGWGLAVSGYSGEPGKGAKPIILFPKHCTAACEVDEAERCPVCEGPDGVKEEKEAEQRQVVAPGESHTLAWDGMVHVYKKTKGLSPKGKKKSCECYERVMVEPNTYTLRACGLRVTKSAKKTSKYQCVTAEVELPPSEPTTIKFDFGAPPAK